MNRTRGKRAGDRHQPIGEGEKFALALDALLAGHLAVRITVKGHMPLCVERIGWSPQGRAQIAISHVGVLEGDLMRDPELVFDVYAVNGVRTAEPVSVRNDYMGTTQDVYFYDENGALTHLAPGLGRDLSRFAVTWFRNLREQGFFDSEAKLEVLA